MLFKSLGVAIATNSASSSDEDTKAVTIRLTDSEIQLYDTVAKSMGLTRQDFISHLIRSNFRQSLKEFVIGYTDSNPSIPLSVFLIHILKIQTFVLSYPISLPIFLKELMEEDERASHEEMENYISSPLAPLRKGIFVEKGDSE